MSDLITCPACKTRYLVPDTAIGPTGRQVRCASCKHSWFEEPSSSFDPGAAAGVTPPPGRAAPDSRFCDIVAGSARTRAAAPLQRRTAAFS